MKMYKTFCLVCARKLVHQSPRTYCSGCDPEIKRRLTEAKLEALRRKEMGPITPDEYVRLAMRTECEELEPLARMCPLQGEPLLPIRLAHALLGISGEAGELSENVKKWIFYGRPLDRQEMKEELGDLLWYVALACDALGVPLSEVMEANIRKLKNRYPEKFTTDKANNRDTVAEREATVATRGCIREKFEKSVDSGGTRETRTRSQVVAQQNSFSGCCDKNVDQTGCDCLDNAIPDEEDETERGG